MKISIEVRDLKPGDVLWPTNRTVVDVWKSTRVTGYHSLVLRRQNGSQEPAQFRSYTKVTVERGER